MNTTYSLKTPSTARRFLRLTLLLLAGSCAVILIAKGLRPLSESEHNVLTTLLGLMVLGIPVMAFLTLVNYIAPPDKDILLTQNGHPIDSSKLNHSQLKTLRRTAYRHWKNRLTHHKENHDYWGWTKTYFTTPLRNELPTSTASPDGAAMQFGALPLLPTATASLDPETKLPYFTIATSADNNLHHALNELGIQHEMIIPTQWNPYTPSFNSLLNKSMSRKEFLSNTQSFESLDSDPASVWASRGGLNALIYPSNQWEYIAAAAIAAVSTTENPAITKTEAINFIDRITYRHVFVHEGRNLTTTEIFEWARSELYGSHEVMATDEHFPHPAPIHSRLTQQGKSATINA